MKIISIITLVTVASFGYAQKPLSAPDALAIAAKNRPALQAARLKVEQARIAAKASGAFLPTTLGIGASTRSTVGATDQDLYIEHPLDLFGQGAATRKLGAQSVQVALAEYSAAAGEFQNQVLTGFAEAVSLKRQAAVAEALLQISEGLLSATRRRFEEGNIPEIQLTRARIENERTKLAAEMRRKDAAAAMLRLAGLLAAPLETLEVDSEAEIVPLAKPEVGARSDIQMLTAQVQLAEAGAGIARVSSRPDLSVQLVRSPWGDSRGYFVGRAQITWKLFDHGKARNEEMAANVQALAAEKQLVDAIGIAYAELNAAQIELDARQESIESLQRILLTTFDLVAKSQKGFSEGFGTQIDVLESVRALREVELELVEAKRQRSMAVIAQYRAAGFISEVLK